jgi:hypothetical protein
MTSATPLPHLERYEAAPKNRNQHSLIDERFRTRVELRRTKRPTSPSLNAGTNVR